MTQSQKTQVILIDDHELYRDGVTLFLQLQSDIEVLAAVDNPIELYRQIQEQLPDVVLMDINLPQQSGIDLAKQLLKEYPKLKIIFMTGNESQAYLEQSLKAGGLGFVPKSSPKTEVLTAIRCVMMGQYYFPPTVSQEVFRGYIAQLHQPGVGNPLTDRELDVLRCFANGLSFKEIEDQLSISKKTVEHHKKAIFDKLGFTNNAELVKYAIKNHIIEL